MSESDSSEAPTFAKKSRRSFTIEKKLEIVAYAKSNSINAAAKTYVIDRKNIRSWKNDEMKLRALCDPGQINARQLPGSGRPLKDKEFDDALAVWVCDRRQKKLRVSRQMMQKEA